MCPGGAREIGIDAAFQREPEDAGHRLYRAAQALLDSAAAVVTGAVTRRFDHRAVPQAVEKRGVDPTIDGFAMATLIGTDRRRRLRPLDLRQIDKDFDCIENYPGFGYRWRDS